MKKKPTKVRAKVVRKVAPIVRPTLYLAVYPSGEGEWSGITCRTLPDARCWMEGQPGEHILEIPGGPVP